MTAPYYQDEHVTLWHGDALEVLRGMDDCSVDCIVTSPPYYGLRDYGVDGQLGAEASPAEYVENMRALFAEARRVLADDGTLWLNLGDSYSSGSGGQSALAALGARLGTGGGHKADASKVRRAPTASLPPKNLLGIPWMVARALQQPQYTGRIQSETDRAWLAGWIDGEGSITYVERDRGESHTATHDVRVFVTNCDDAPLRHFSAICGGHVYVHDDGTRANRYGKRPVYRWQMGTHDSAGLLRELYPYLRTKRRQAALVWTLFTTLRHQNGHARTPADIVARRREIGDMVRTLNAGGEVTLPAWVQEPPPHEEPGWILRNDIIWAKPNGMPNSVVDRLATKHEHIFLLTKSPRYWFDLDPIRKPHSEASISRYATPIKFTHPSADNNGQRGQIDGGHTPERGVNPGDVWTIATQPFAEAHFAVMPPTLAERCVLAGCKPGGTVLDPFSGSGTTGLAAAKHGRRYVGIDLNADYLDLSLRTRLQQPGLDLEGIA